MLKLLEVENDKTTQPKFSTAVRKLMQEFRIGPYSKENVLAKSTSRFNRSKAANNDDLDFTATGSFKN